MNETRLLPAAPPVVPAPESTPPGGAPAGAAPVPAASPHRPPEAGRPARSGRLFAFASGKGGVGKSLLVANLGIQLARQGRSVTLLDCDLACSTLHSYLGTAAPETCLDELLSGRSSSLVSLSRDTSVPGLRLVAGSRGACRPLPSGEELESLVLKAYELPADCVLIDLPSGRHPLSLALLELADYGVLVTTPEPSALEGGFRLVEEIARRALDHPDAQERKAAEAALGAEASERGLAAFLDALADVDPALAGRLGERLTRLRLGFVINQSRSEGEAQSALNLRGLCRHYLGVELEFGGVVEFDLSAWQATRQRKSLSQKYPNAPATRTIEQIAASLLGRCAPEPTQRGGWLRLEDRTLYEILEVPPAASQRDLQRSYDRLQSVAGPDLEALGGSVQPERVRAVRARVEAAYRTLVFLESRSEYDRSLLASGRVRQEELRDLRLETAMTSAPRPGAAPFPAAAGPQAGGAPQPQPSEPTPAPELRPAGATGTPVVYSGPVLAALRRERGLSLEAIGAVSKVRTAHLRCVEEERFGELPAPVFLKGYVREYARCLSLDPVRVWQDYLARYEQWKRNRSEP